MTISIPEKIECFISSEGIPVAGLMVWARFETISKNPYTMFFGPTDQKGYVSICKADMQLQASQELELAIMDFSPIEVAFSGHIEVSIMGISDIDNALRAYEMFKKGTFFPVDYSANLVNAKQVLRNIDNSQKLSLTVKVIPSCICLTIR